METDQRLSAASGAGSGGFVVWLTGLPASGKSTLAHLLIGRLATVDCHALLLDSDDLRKKLTPKAVYDAQERDWFYRVLGDLSILLAGHGVNVIVAATGNRRVYRDYVRARTGHFAEVFVLCPPEICRARDPKGIFERAQRGNAPTVPGVGADYEAPSHPEATIETGQISEEAAATLLFNALAHFFAPFCAGTG